MGDRRVDEDRPQAHEPEHRRELHALRESAGDERRRDDREGHLEAHVDGFGNRRRERVRIADAAVVDVAEDALQESAAQSADERRAGRERQRIGDEGVHHRHKAGDGEAGHHRVADILLAHHAAIEEPETRDRHHQHERHRGQHPCRVAAARRAIRQDGRDRGDGGEFVGFRDGGDGARACRRSRGRGLCGGGGGGSGRRRGRRCSGGRVRRRGRGGLSVGRRGGREADEGGYRQRRREA